MSKLKALIQDYWHIADPTRIEVSMRITFASFLTYTLSIANIPKVVPLSTSYIVGCLGATLAVVIPTFVFSASFVIPCIVVALIIGVCVSSALLAAGTVSDGLVVAMYAVVTWIMTGCFFGADFELTSPSINAIIAFTGYMTLSFLSLVQDGFTTTVTDAQQVGVISGLVRAALSAACELADQAPNCWEDQLPTLEDGFLTVELPATAGDLAGQTAYVTASPDNSSITINVPGGLWVVSGLWTWKGIENPLAGNRNFLIAMTWACACVVFAILFPPVRTARSLLSKVLVPSVLSVTAQSDSLELFDKNKDRIAHGLTTMDGGKKAVVTTFEPRILTAPLEFIVPLLKDLLIATEQAAMAVAFLLVWNKDSGDSDEKTNDLRAELSVLSVCAKALVVSGEGGATESLKQLKADARVTLEEGQKLLLSPSSYLHDRCEKLLDATIAWLDALNQPQHPRTCSKEASKNLLHTYLPWVVGPVFPIKRMVTVLTLPFRPKTWNWRDTLWSLKYTLGSVALFTASVYSDKYHEFAIETNQGTSGAVFTGWQMLAYTFTFQATMECTIKKGLLRGLGTCLGGLAAWLGIIICSWSYDDDAEINPYGLIAWLTIMTGIAGYFTVDPGTAARLGKSYDHGFAGEYFVLTLSLIGLEAYRGNGSKNALTANRICSNLAGIVMAMLVAFIPPNRKGGDPKHAIEYWASLRDSFVCLLQTLLHEEERDSIKNDDFKASFLADAPFKRRNALYLAKNAGCLKALPFLRVDERLRPLVEYLAVHESSLAYLLEIAEEMVRGDSVNHFAKGSEAHHKLVKLLKGFDDVQEEDNGDNDQMGAMEEPGQAYGAEDPTALFLVMAHAISNGLHSYEADLVKIFPQHYNISKLSAHHVIEVDDS